jgi:hypothetical protein
MSGLPGAPCRYLRISGEDLHSMEISHAQEVRNHHIEKSFQDHWLTGAGD